MTCGQQLTRRLCLAAVYSKWTNSSFKAPLITSSLACLAGNVLYCAGYDLKSVWVLTASRLVLGFGEFCLSHQECTALRRLALHFAIHHRLMRVDPMPNILGYHMIVPHMACTPFCRTAA